MSETTHVSHLDFISPESRRLILHLDARTGAFKAIRLNATSDGNADFIGFVGNSHDDDVDSDDYDPDGFLYDDDGESRSDGAARHGSRSGDRARTITHTLSLPRKDDRVGQFGLTISKVGIRRSRSTHVVYELELHNSEPPHGIHRIVGNDDVIATTTAGDFEWITYIAPENNTNLTQVTIETDEFGVRSIRPIWMSKTEGGGIVGVVGAVASNESELSKKSKSTSLNAPSREIVATPTPAPIPIPIPVNTHNDKTGISYIIRERIADWCSDIGCNRCTARKVACVGIGLAAAVCVWELYKSYKQPQAITATSNTSGSPITTTTSTGTTSKITPSNAYRKGQVPLSSRHVSTAPRSLYRAYPYQQPYQQPLYSSRQ